MQNNRCRIDNFEDLKKIQFFAPKSRNTKLYSTFWRKYRTAYLQSIQLYNCLQVGVAVIVVWHYFEMRVCKGHTHIDCRRLSYNVI